MTGAVGGAVTRGPRAGVGSDTPLPAPRHTGGSRFKDRRHDGRNMSTGNGNGRGQLTAAMNGSNVNLRAGNPSSL